jgi:lipoprotein-anchoring transpeptidase ErfK/SrfK
MGYMIIISREKFGRGLARHKRLRLHSAPEKDVLRSAGMACSFALVMRKREMSYRIKPFRKFAAVMAFFAVHGGASARELVEMKESYPMGAIVIDTSERSLYYSLGQNAAIRYPVAVGRQGMAWSGETFVQSKRVNPTWTPTPNMRRQHPGLPRHVRGGIPQNPLGVRAIYLGWSDYRIHGTNAPWSIGRAASSGCIRMLNADVKDLYDRVHIGAPVYVVK